MTLFHVVTNAKTGQTVEVPFTAEEESARAVEEAAFAKIPDRVTARQFKMQLEKDGLLDSVEAWVAQQTKLVRIAYANSGTFVRDEPMMQAGFAALGFKTAQIDAFFKSAFAL